MRYASNGLLPSEAGNCPLVGVPARDARLPARGDKHTLTSFGNRFAGGWRRVVVKRSEAITCLHLQSVGTHFDMVLHRVMLCVVVGTVLFAWLPKDLELSLADAVSDPIKSHIHGFGAFLFDRVICYSHGCAVISNHGGGRRGMSEFFEGYAFGDSLLAVQEEASQFGFSCAGEDIFQDFA